ncbi:MAG: penicillin-binding protein activator [Deltaproteobacteria bacterium]|nr:penicillin-binding protein activator [Deltaproteobacteria bacterium]
MNQLIKAISYLMMGIAFSLWGCYPQPTLEIPHECELAEQDVLAGNYDRAIQRYESYLKDHPTREGSRYALYAIARIHYNRRHYDKALALFKRVVREYPRHSELPVAAYDVANTYYLLGDYEKCKEAALNWLESYSTHSMRGEALHLAGKSYRALGDYPQAFSLWVEAGEMSEESPDLRNEIAGNITELIKESSLEDLKEMSQYADESPYLPHITYQMASLYLEDNQLENAKSMAMALVRSTPEQSWISRGRVILEKIEQEVSVKKNAVGCLLPLSGPYAIYGQEVLNGIQLGMGLGNPLESAQGIELVIKDTRGEADDAVLAVEELVREERVMAIIGPLASREISGAARKAQEWGVPIVTLTQKEDITAEGEMVFRNYLIPSREIQALVEKAINGLDLKRFAIFYPDNRYGHTSMNLFWDRVEELGGTITSVESYDPDETDFAVEIKKMVGLHYWRPRLIEQTVRQDNQIRWENEIQEKHPSEENPAPIVDFDAIFIPDAPQRVALIAPQFPFYNIFGVRLLGTRLWQSTELIDQAKDYVKGAIFPVAFFGEGQSNGLEEFVKLYRDNYESEPTDMAANGYDTIRLLKAVMNDGDGVHTRRGLQRKLILYDGLEGVTGKISFDEQGEVENSPTLLTISDGRFHVISATP